MILLHGFPDDHRVWRPVVPALAGRFRLVMPDLRGYAGSDKPVGVERYRMDQLVGDVVALMRNLGRQRVILVGHDWGAVIAQSVAMALPRRVERLVMLNIPHLSGLLRELARSRDQQAASFYARLFQDGVGSGPIDWSILRRQLGASRHGRMSLDVLRRSYVTGLLDYYRANYPRPPYRFDEADADRRIIRVPTLILYGAQDPFVLPACFDDIDRWFDPPPRIVKFAGAGHWVHHDALDAVAQEVLRWLPSAD